MRLYLVDFDTGYDARAGAIETLQPPHVPDSPTPAQATGVNGKGLDLLECAQTLSARLECRFPHDPVSDPLLGPHLEIESDSPARERDARNPGARVRNAEIRTGLFPSRRARAYMRRITGCKCRGRCEARLLSLLEYDLARLDGAAEKLPQRMQCKRDPGEARTALTAQRMQRETPSVGKTPREGVRCLRPPLTTQVGLI